jgi:hypothetical protein
MRRREAAAGAATPYDPVKRLLGLGQPLLAQSVHENTEVTIYAGGATYCVYRPRLVLNVSNAGEILLGDPMGAQLRFDAAAVRASSGVSRMPSRPGIAWERWVDSW